MSKIPAPQRFGENPSPTDGTQKDALRGKRPAQPVGLARGLATAFGRATTGRELEIAAGFIWARWIHVELDNVHARLRAGMTGAYLPRSVTEPDVTDLAELKAFPAAAGGQAAAASAGELVSQRDFLSLAVAEDDRAELARVPVIKTKNLFALCHGAGEQVKSLA